MSTGQNRQEGKATIMRGPDGQIYFIRDEVLEACRVPDDLAKEIEQTLGGQEVRGFSLDTSQPLEPIGTVEGNVGASGPGAEGAARPRSTLMCPGWITWGSAN